MDQNDFRTILHNLLVDVYDFAALEKNPLNDIIPRVDPNISKSENIRRFVNDGIEQLKPKGDKTVMLSLEWRYYLILRGRYIEGKSVADLQKQLALGERQERRLHRRAFTLLSDILWDRLTISHADKENPSSPKMDEVVEETPDYTISIEKLQLNTIIDEVYKLWLPRSQAKNIFLDIRVPKILPTVRLDRVLLRQILLDLINQFYHLDITDLVTIQGRYANGSVILELLAYFKDKREAKSIETSLSIQTRYWIDRLGGRLETKWIDDDDVQGLCYTLELPTEGQSVLLVVDDHEPAIRIIQRFLSQTEIQVVGTSDPTQIFSLINNHHPKAVLLDVMMPAMDGWEILQKLKNDPKTKYLPVIICSVWEQPDLAYSLGANGFLKKPINQVDLMKELTRINLLDTSAGSQPTDS